MPVIQLDRAGIEELLPQRGRALMLNRAEVDTNSHTATGYFTVTKEVCEGHVPGIPIFKATDRLEVLFLTLAIAVGSKLPRGKIAVAAAASGISWPSVARAGDEIRSEVTLTRIRTKTIMGSGVLYVGNQQVCIATSMLGRVVDVNKLR